MWLQKVAHTLCICVYYMRIKAEHRDKSAAMPATAPIVDYLHWTVHNTIFTLLNKLLWLLYVSLCVCTCLHRVQYYMWERASDMRVGMKAMKLNIKHILREKIVFNNDNIKPEAPDSDVSAWCCRWWWWWLPYSPLVCVCLCASYRTLYLFKYNTKIKAFWIDINKPIYIIIIIELSIIILHIQMCNAIQYSTFDAHFSSFVELKFIHHKQESEISFLYLKLQRAKAYFYHFNCSQLSLEFCISIVLPTTELHNYGNFYDKFIIK